MAHVKIAAVWLCALWICSCSSSGDGDGSAGDASGTGGAQAGTGAADASTDADGSVAGAGGSSNDECDDPAESADGGAPLLQCNAIGAGACSECMGEKCCDLLELCAVDADCACMAMCIGSSSLTGVDACLGTCDVSGSPPGFADLAGCVAVTCPDGDECSAPANFMPPPSAEPTGSGSGSSIGSGRLADCSFDAGLSYDPDGPVLQLQSADQDVCVRIERRNDGPGSLANTSWTLINMRVGPLGEVALIDQPSDICWYSSHHNFNDWMHAWSGSRRYDLKMARANHGIAPTYALHVFAQGPLDAAACAPTADGACPIGSEIELFAVNP